MVQDFQPVEGSRLCAGNGSQMDIPLFRLLTTADARIISAESAFAAYMLAFSIRTGRGI